MIKNSDSVRTTPAQEYATQYLHGMNPFGVFANISGIVKAIKDPPQENAAKDGADNLMPSVGSYRMVSRIKSQAYAQDKKHKGHATDNYLSELLGTFTSGATPTIIGGLVGAYLTKGKLMDSSSPWKERLAGVGGGAGIGVAVATAANLVGLIGSTISKRRTEMQQVDHDKRRRWEEWFVPGIAMYNKGKRLGRSEGDYDEHPETHSKIKAELADRRKNESDSMKWLKALALLAGIGMTGYGIYKLPKVLAERKDKIVDMAHMAK